MVSSGICSNANALTISRTAGAPCQRRADGRRVGFRRCQGRILRRTLVSKSSPIGCSMRSRESDATTNNDINTTVVPASEASPAASSTSGSIDACMSACLDAEDRAASAAAGLLSRINAGMIGNLAVNDKVEQSPTQHAPLREDCDANLDHDERAAAAASKFLERVRASNALNCSFAMDVSPLCRKVKRVQFDMSALVIHSVTPYGEIYGMHPREFVFSKDYHMLPAAPPHGFVGLESARDEEDGESSDSDDE